MGVFEMDNFSSGTFAVADAIVKATERGAFSLVGGGDTVSAINKFHLTDRIMCQRQEEPCWSTAKESSCRESQRWKVKKLYLRNLTFSHN
jgi:hypothetical protein